MKKSVIFLFVIVFAFTLRSQDETQIFAVKLYNQAAALLNKTKPECAELSKNNGVLADAVSVLSKKAAEHKNSAANVFANAEYLLKFLQESIDKSCGLVNMANEESIRLIIAEEFDQLLAKHKASGSFEDFIDKIYGTEYGKLLYLVTSVSSLNKMYTKWAVKMISEKNDPQKTISNIASANAELRQELTEFTKTFKLYYEK